VIRLALDLGTSRRLDREGLDDTTAATVMTNTDEGRAMSLNDAIAYASANPAAEERSDSAGPT
jgi:hypothetical protein